ncbi:3TM-type holin [Endozoicomonas sp. GU-1]|uniref:3TM-type holin n=1 Tax=Endozoicomonas sp. GU-1 TaxID=3009078 RepID=UPI0022B31A9C|nr:3TM-type holin [Endozoicomonas sp. GU-1]WBA86525.1 3TM-type holin [Endozoicomonas sp. GU-1]
MSFISSFFSKSAAEPVEAVGKVLDNLFTSDEERLDKQAVIQRLRQQPQLAQIEINKVEAGHRSVFVAGWRPFIGWVCGIGLAFIFVINPILQWWSGKPGPVMPSDILMELVLALLGLGALRTVEKKLGISK